MSEQPTASVRRERAVSRYGSLAALARKCKCSEQSVSRAITNGQTTLSSLHAALLEAGVNVRLDMPGRAWRGQLVLSKSKRALAFRNSPEWRDLSKSN